MIRLKSHAARSIADNNYATKRRAANGATTAVKRLVLSKALKKVKCLERQVEQAVARADNCEGKFIMQKKSRFTALNELRQVINAHKQIVKRSVHNKLKMSATEKMKVDQRNKRLQKALAYREMIHDHM